MESWDKTMTKKLMDLGLDFEKARSVVGIMVEERQQADQYGYCRGYTNGYRDSEEKKVKLNRDKEHLLERLREVMTNPEEWMELPNPLFSGKKPSEVINTQEQRFLEQYIYNLEVGIPN